MFGPKGFGKSADQIVGVVGHKVLPAAGGRSPAAGQGDSYGEIAVVHVLNRLDQVAGQQIVPVIVDRAPFVFQPDPIAAQIESLGAAGGNVRAVLRSGNRRPGGDPLLDLECA